MKELLIIEKCKIMLAPDMVHPEDSGAVCADREEATISTRSIHRRVKQRESRARRRAAKRGERHDAKDEAASDVGLSGDRHTAVASCVADSSQIPQQSATPNSKDASTRERISKNNDDEHIRRETSQHLEGSEEKTNMHHQGTRSAVEGAAAPRRRPGPAQRNMHFFRRLFESDTRPNDWSLVCEMQGQHAAFPDTDQPVPIGKISALVWEIEYAAVDVIDRPLSGFKEVKRLYAEKTKEVTFFKKKLVMAQSMNNRVLKKHMDTKCIKEESAMDYRSLKYAELLLAYLIPILKVQQAKLEDLMWATGEAYSQFKAHKRLYKRQHRLRESVETLKQSQLEVRKQTQKEGQGGQQRTDYWISEWKKVQNALKEAKRDMVSDENFWKISRRHNLSRQAYEEMLRAEQQRLNCIEDSTYI